MTATTADAGPAPERSAGSLAIGSWMLYDWAAQPYYTLITTFLFAPYFTAVVIGDATEGTALWGYMQAGAAILVALCAPILGALADERGRLKPLIALFSICFVLTQAVLWYAVPNAEALTVALILAAVIVATLCVEFGTVLTNALMPRLVPADRLGRLSGGGWALGYAGGLISLIIMASFFLSESGTGRTLFGLEPLLPLDPDAGEPNRFVGPFSALWYAVFVLPFFLFTPDAPPNRTRTGVSLRAALASVGDTISHIRQYRDIALFFIARMLFIDGLLAIFTFGGIYAVSVFDWAPVIVGYFGIILAATAGIGALLGGFLDDRLGSKRVVIGALLILIIGALGVISIDKQHILFVIETTPPAEDGAPFASAGEIVYLAFAILIGLAGGPLQAASRSLLARMAPPEHLSEFFGFFAFSGKITAFAAPLVIGILSSATGNLQIAMSAILVFLVAGLIVMSFVRTPS